MAVEVKKRDAYSGDRKKQLREGFGVYNYDNKFFRYEGEWEAGKKQGHGKLAMADGGYYEGEFQNGEIEGHGFRYFTITGNTYSGQFHQGEMHGQGVMKYSDGSVYEGEWNRNVRQGYGILRSPDNEVYQGYLHDHKRHGEGTQVYSNGDRYDGDWVNNKRQGHGELRCRDGSNFAGQWLSDVFSGQGTFNHASGMVYEGLWLNGLPAVMADRLVIKAESSLELIQGMPFTLTVECQNEEGEVVEDQGRDIQITAGFKYYPPKQDGDKPQEDSSANLFDVIEDVEEMPISTPFGYDIVSYPLTDQLQAELLLAESSSMSLTLGGKTRTDLSEAPIAEEPSGQETQREEQQGESKKEEEKTERTTSPSLQESATVVGTETATSSDPQNPGTLDDGSLPPPVSNRKTVNGQVVFENLILPGAPPMYRPFLAVEEEEASKKKRKTSKTEIKSDDEGSRPGTRAKKEKTQPGDEKFSRPGEYVIMVQDATNPPFMGIGLKPAFVLVKINLPKKQPKRRVSKERGPRSTPS